ncbi:hypothetical protein DFH08DRAFT_1030994 [Mycena albidolilacea]|uniref:Uncharacterized protein n=1 Tax=Mycena albidolilacea TaxID=1033008 RepID=A0AAD7EZS9_9AGAR|nr:hypothetical protein DFH08DRAFT_1030994 [Mycena albidolilacea]
MLQKTENMSPGSDVEFTPSSEPTPANINLDLTAKNLMANSQIISRYDKESRKRRALESEKLERLQGEQNKGFRENVTTGRNDGRVPRPGLPHLLSQWLKTLISVRFRPRHFNSILENSAMKTETKSLRNLGDTLASPSLSSFEVAANLVAVFQTIYDPSTNFSRSIVLMCQLRGDTAKNGQESRVADTSLAVAVQVYACQQYQSNPG